ncbi:MAG: von Willebrand factor type A domain-containing protein [Saprospiraceae bacterium]
MKKIYFVIAIMLFTSISLFSQRTITGTITDESGEALISASVTVKGTTIGVTTNLDGEYSIQIPEMDKPVLIFSYIGFENQEIEVGTSNVVDVVLSEGMQLDEVVVVGYGTKRLRGRVSGLAKRKKKNKNSTSSIPPTSPKPSAPQTPSKPLSTPEPHAESYARINENAFKTVKREPLSTFSIDVDKASYSNVRRFIDNGQQPPKDAVRVEEMINYFNYDYEAPTGEHPIVVHTELGVCPWNKNHELMKVGLKAKEIPKDNLPPSNLVFLLDVSGSMIDDIELVKSAMKVLVKQLREEDKVSIVVYAGAAGLVLAPTDGSNKDKIMNALDGLRAGGSTAGGAGIRLAYKTAKEQFIEGGNNRIILATDGDFNIGMSSDRAMEDLIVEKRKSGIYLTCLGFGMGNYQDAKMEILADKGNGNYAYIDSKDEAIKVFQNEFSGTMFTVAKDVKFQLEFNPAVVAGYRLIGYENRLLEEEDFDDDTKDAGEIGIGHTVTALYEIIPTGVESEFLPEEQKLKYQKNGTGFDRKKSEILTVKLRYKPTDATESIKLEYPIKYNLEETNSNDFYFASSVALFGMTLRKSEFIKDGNDEMIVNLATKGQGNDKNGYRKEFIEIVKKANGKNLAILDAGED